MVNSLFKSVVKFESKVHVERCDKGNVMTKSNNNEDRSSDCKSTNYSSVYSNIILILMKMVLMTMIIMIIMNVMFKVMTT